MAEAAPSVVISVYTQYTDTATTPKQKVKMSFNAMLTMGDDVDYEVVNFGYLVYLAKSSDIKPTTTFYDKDGVAHKKNFLSLDTMSVSGEGSYAELSISEYNEAGQFYGAMTTTVVEGYVMYVKPYVIYKDNATDENSANWTIGYGNALMIPVATAGTHGDITETHTEVTLVWNEDVLEAGDYVNYN